jgi:predicted nucleic acid-binding protein
MSTRSVQDIAEETLQRVIRTETRLMTLGTKLGHDLKDDEYIEVVVDSKAIYLATLDVPYTSVIKAARRAGLHKQKVSVWFDGALVAEMPV